MAMRWFNKEKPKDTWEEPVAGPLGDIEAAHRIRDRIRVAHIGLDQLDLPDMAHRRQEKAEIGMAHRDPNKPPPPAPKRYPRPSDKPPLIRHA